MPQDPENNLRHWRETRYEILLLTKCKKEGRSCDITKDYTASPPGELKIIKMAAIS